MQSARVLSRLILKGRRGLGLGQVYHRRPKSKKTNFPEVTLNDLPSPEGDFYTHHNARQRIYNMQLVGGIGAWAIAIAFGIATDMFEFYNDIPEIVEIECYKD